MKATQVRRLFWDIETSPNVALSWRIGRKISLNHENLLKERAIICICYKWEGERKVHSLEWDKGDDRKLLEDFTSIANESDEMIAHNGDRFDLPMFQGRRLIHGMAPVPEYKTVDTLAIARRRFSLNCNRLDYIGQVLGLGQKHRTEFQMWRDILLDNCPKAMGKMVRYCKQDVKLLEQVWEKLEPYHRPKTHAGALATLERWTCPRCASDAVKQDKRRISAAGIPSYSMQCKGCGKFYSIPQNVHRHYLEEKHASANREG